MRLTSLVSLGIGVTRYNRAGREIIPTFQKKFPNFSNSLVKLEKIIYIQRVNL